MEYRKLGKTGLEVSVIAMGCEGFKEDDFQMTKRMFDRAEEAGINFFDHFIPDPRMQRAVGQALRGRRDKFILQAHFCTVYENGQYKRTRDLATVRRTFENTLQNFGVDYADIGMIHMADSLDDWHNVRDNGVLDYALEMKQLGRIHHVGLSSHNPVVALEAVQSGLIEVLLFSINPLYDLMPPYEDVSQIWSPESYANPLVNMDPDRQALYEYCSREGIGLCAMKAFGGGDLLDSSLSPAHAALTVPQCIHYCLTRPGVSSVHCGFHSLTEMDECIAYLDAPAAARDFAKALASFPTISWKGHCMYCNHCLPCPSQIDIASVTKYLNLCRAQGRLPDTVREHYADLKHHAGECIRCGACESRCPFAVPVRQNMQAAQEIFGY